jgi:hypothetical protein
VASYLIRKKGFETAKTEPQYDLTHWVLFQAGRYVEVSNSKTTAADDHIPYSYLHVTGSVPNEPSDNTFPTTWNYIPVMKRGSLIYLPCEIITETTVYENLNDK